MGLGNYGSQFSKNRHNVGSLALDYLLAKNGLKYKNKAMLMSDVCEWIIDPKHSLFLMKPQSFMNIIGKNVGKALRKHKLKSNQIVVLHDDLEQKLGRVRVVSGTSFK